MDVQTDHYQALGLPSGEEGSKLTINEISKAYRTKALELHPDKRLNDPNAHTNFQNLKTSYEILKDENARKAFDDLLRVKRENLRRQSQYDGKRRKMMSDLEERERASFAPDPAAKTREEEERISKKLREEIARIRAELAKNTARGRAEAEAVAREEAEAEARRSSGTRFGDLDGERVLKVSWEGNGDDYSAQRLKELFGEFGEVEDVVIRLKGGKKKRARSALVVMATKDAAISAMGTVCGDLSNPLLVLPLQKTAPAEFPSFAPMKNVEPEPPLKKNLVGAGYQAYEDSVLEKLRKKAAEQKK